MNRLENFRFADFRRRKRYVYVIVFAGIVLIALLILLWLGVFNYRAELVTLRPDGETDGSTYGGAGINIDHIPNVNLIRNSSFEASENVFNYSISDAQGNRLFLSPEEVKSSGIDTGEIKGGRVNILSIDADGIMSTKFEGTVNEFDIAKFGSVNIADSVVHDLKKDPVIKTASAPDITCLLTESGRLIGNILTGDTASEDKRLYADICSDGKGIYAVTPEGALYRSSDGIRFTLVNDYSEKLNGSEITAVCSGGDEVIMLADSGDIIYADTGSIVKIPGGKATFIAAVTEKFLVVTEDGRHLISDNGLVFEETDVRCEISFLTSRDGMFYEVTGEGRVKTYDPVAGKITEYAAAYGDDSEVTGISVTPSKQIILSKNDKKVVMISEPGGNEILVSSSDDVRIDGIYDHEGGILFCSDGKVYTGVILSDFVLDKQIPQDTVYPGDICILKTTDNDMSVNNVFDGWKILDKKSGWDVYGKNTIAESSKEAFSGSSAMKFSGTGDDLHVLSQELKGLSSDNFAKDTFYRISLNMKGLVADGNNVSIWLEGANFGKVGFNAEIGNTYKDYSYVFAVTKHMPASEKVRLNIAFSGSGFVYVDDVYVGQDRYSGGEIPEYYINSLSEAHPAIIRLNNLKFGSKGFCESSFYGLTPISSGSIYKNDLVSECVSLEDSLNLVRKCQASPWLVFGSAVTSEDVDHLFEYLCGSFKSEYGLKRINNNNAFPWTRQFDNIYVEISDTEGVFSGDVSKSAYVNYIISLIKKNEYYSDFKDKIVFIDGMTYDGGTMMSKADGHAMDMKINVKNKNYSKKLEETFTEALYNSPRRHVGGDSNEFIRSFSIDSGLSCGQILNLLLTDKGSFISRMLIDVDVNFVPVNYDSDKMFSGKSTVNTFRVLNTVSVLNGSNGLYPVILDPLNETTGQSAEALSAVCTTAVKAKDDKIYMVITNYSDTSVQFLISKGAVDYDKAKVYRYSSKGVLLTDRPLGSSGLRHNLEPGEFMLVDILLDK